MKKLGIVDEGDLEAAFVDLYRSSLSTVLGFLFVRTGGNRDLSQDLAAETFALAVEQFNAGRSAVVTPGWLVTVARRRLIDHWRRQATVSRKRPLLERSTPTVVDTTDAAQVERQAVADAMGALNDDYRLALVLHHIDGYSVREVAEVLGRTEKAAESLIGRAKEAFRQNYEGRHDGEL